MIRLRLPDSAAWTQLLPYEPIPVCAYRQVSVPQPSATPAGPKGWTQWCRTGLVCSSQVRRRRARSGESGAEPALVVSSPLVRPRAITRRGWRYLRNGADSFAAIGVNCGRAQEPADPRLGARRGGRRNWSATHSPAHIAAGSLNTNKTHAQGVGIREARKGSA